MCPDLPNQSAEGITRSSQRWDGGAGDSGPRPASGFVLRVTLRFVLRFAPTSFCASFSTSFCASHPGRRNAPHFPL